jgi:hypothetical protein
MLVCALQHEKQASEDGKHGNMEKYTIYRYTFLLICALSTAMLCFPAKIIESNDDSAIAQLLCRSTLGRCFTLRSARSGGMKLGKKQERNVFGTHFGVSVVGKF